MSALIVHHSLLSSIIYISHQTLKSSKMSPFNHFSVGNDISCFRYLLPTCGERHITSCCLHAWILKVLYWTDSSGDILSCVFRVRHKAQLQLLTLVASLKSISTSLLESTAGIWCAPDPHEDILWFDYDVVNRCSISYKIIIKLYVYRQLSSLQDH